ncbi:hypothetical protein ASF01_16395 [Stenotrophomonas sp. Leaf70]|uniref:Uncharacterized protein n=1 Tax=Stenotrophomonas nitritireducens TaxID=83617 RepID=A0ABR5NKX2_9GAMM|nr:hypothetical protein ASF01_16395 [Stenotrophomonas sp. Leaf70]KRG58509.1 hypothetical protein ABB22_06630 [Stenotrophomonas nitritireducens]
MVDVCKVQRRASGGFGGFAVEGIEFDAENIERPQYQLQFRPGFAFLDFDDPLPADAGLMGQACLVPAQRLAALQDHIAQVGRSLEGGHAVQCKRVLTLRQM